LTGVRGAHSVLRMGRLRRHKPVLSWFAAIALLGNALAMAFLVPVTAAALVDDILGPVVLCTADGAKTVPGGGSGSGGHAPSNHCPACVTTAQFVLAVILVLSAVAFPLLSTQGPLLRQARALALHLGRGGIRPRAPPLSA
jgi:hypothetical protein